MSNDSNKSNVGNKSNEGGITRAESSELPVGSGDASENAAPRMLFNPPIDIYETADGLVLYADLPGVNSEGLDLQVQDNRLALFGRVETPVGSAETIHQEYQEGDFLRSFILSDEVDHDQISARLNNGVLRVELPRSERAEPRRIEVST